MEANKRKEILNIEDLFISFNQYEKGLHRVDINVITNLSVNVMEGEIVAIVGSSGSGKSLLAHAVLGLLPKNANVRGRISFRGELLTAKRIGELRGKEICLVPQSVGYLDPLMKVGIQVRHSRDDEETKKRQQQLFDDYALKEGTAELYPFELSGGMARRVLLASALMENPKLIIADEPTPGLDLPLAKKAMADFRDFADKGNGVLLITHDIELALEVADRIAVFYAGTTVEEALVSDFNREETLRHPYTKALWRAFPQHGFRSLDGVQPYVKEMPSGCPFAPRCESVEPACSGEIPLRTVAGGTVRCVRFSDNKGEHGEKGAEENEA